MDNSTPLSFFKEQIQIGETTIPLGCIFLVAFFMVAIMGINSIYLKRRNQIISYLKKNHPRIYEEVRRKPDIGIFYSKAHNSSKPIIELAKRSQNIDDVKLRTLLSDFVKFNQALTWVSVIIIVSFLLSILELLAVLSGQ
ncbi:MAG: hypothetical protein F6J95_008700 [Leptolyngbya sp. SIO1E4]|nr:hypothetical protein [Leptolyngbya sp. SIO1E4]